MKKFLLICSKSSMGYVTDTFRDMKDGEVRTGYTKPKSFTRPDGTEKSVASLWLTNRKGDDEKARKTTTLIKSYSEDPTAYPKLDNYDAIEVGRVKDIPYDYEGPMAVPVTYLENPLPGYKTLGMLTGEHTVIDGVYVLGHQGRLNGKNLFTRIIIQKETPMAKNEKLKKARKAKDDEFYTHDNDIAAEVSHYRRALKGRWIYSPFSDYRYSKFVAYFTEHFHELDLKHYTATCFDNGDGAWRYDFDGQKATVTKLDGNGSFDSAECTAIKDACDFVIDNQPFSLHHEIRAWLASAPDKTKLVKQTA